MEKDVTRTNVKQIQEKCLTLILEKYPTVPVLLRDTNRNKRLEKGFWFYGNDSYTLISFWKAWDDNRNLPNIHIRLNTKGFTTLVMLDSDNGRKEKFFAQISSALGLTKTDRKSSANQWIKNYPTDDYLKVLENFVKVERTIINNLIIAHGLEKELPSVTKRELKDALEIIALFR